MLPGFHSARNLGNMQAIHANLTLTQHGCHPGVCLNHRQDAAIDLEWDDGGGTYDLP